MWRSANAQLVESDRDLTSKLATLRAAIESGRALLARSGVKLSRRRSKKSPAPVQHQPTSPSPTLTIVPSPTATPATVPPPAVIAPLGNVG